MTLETIKANTSYVDSSFSAYKTSQLSIVSTDNNATPKIEKPDDDINDTVTISDKAMKLYAQDKAAQESSTQTTSTTNGTSSDTEINKANKKLSKAEQQEVVELKKRDSEVKTHEQAHLSAAAGLSASAPSYTYQTGPDGQEYAIGGEVSVTFVESNDPEENIKNAQTMKAAALAPADPSGQDRAVARNADQIISQAEQQLKEQENEKNNSSNQSLNSTETSSDKSQDNQEIADKNISV